MFDRAVAVSSFAFLLLSAVPARAATAPDLAVRQIAASGKQTTVYVSNTGDTDSGVFQLHVVALSGDGKALQAVDVDVPSIAAHQFSRVDVELPTAGAHRVTAIADAKRAVKESDETNNSKSELVAVKIAPADGATGGHPTKIEIPPATKPAGPIKITPSKDGNAGAQPKKIVIPPAPPAGDIAIQQIKFGSTNGKDTVTVSIRNVGEQPWKEGKRELVLTRTAMLPSGPVTTTVGKLAALPPLAPGEVFNRLFPRPSSVAGATSYKWEATLAAGDANAANDHLSKTTSVTKFDDNE